MTTRNQARRITAVSLIATSVLLSACSGGQDDDAEVDLTQTSPNVEWKSGPSGLDTPTGAAGPHETNPVPHGWDHNPHGAVLAAIAGQVWMAGADDATFPQVSTTMLEPGPGRTQWAQARALVTVDGQVSDPVKFTGFYFGDYSDDRATVVVATEWPDGARRAFPIQVSHASGDWRVVLPEQGQEPDYTEITDDNDDKFITLTSGDEE